MVDPLVSVIVPVFNGERFLRETLDSVRAQAYPAMELIVVDDGSTDRSRKIATESGASVVSQPNMGLSAARNAGLQSANGEYIAFLDADDVWEPDFIERLLRALVAERGDLAVCKSIQFLSPGLKRPEWVRTEWLEQAMTVPFIGAWLATRTAIERVGKYDQTYSMSEDLDWLARAQDLGVRWTMIEAVLFRRRIHGDNMSLRLDENRPQMFRALRASVARKRAAERPE